MSLKTPDSGQHLFNDRALQLCNFQELVKVNAESFGHIGASKTFLTSLSFLAFTLKQLCAYPILYLNYLTWLWGSATVRIEVHVAEGI
jgi:hypothetical protein